MQTYRIIDDHNELINLTVGNPHSQYTLLTYTNTLSGYLINTINSHTTDISPLSGYLVLRDDSISGYFDAKLNNYTTISVLNSNVNYLSGYINTYSGYIAINPYNFATNTALGALSINVSGMVNNVSGYLDGKFSNYYTKPQIDGLSGYIVSVSGYSNAKYDTILNASSVSGYLDNKFRFNVQNTHIPYMSGGVLGDTGILYDQPNDIVEITTSYFYTPAIGTDSITLDNGNYLQLPNLLSPTASISAPVLGTTPEGAIYYDSTLKTFRININTTGGQNWISLASTSGTSAISGYGEAVYAKRIYIDSVSGYFTSQYATNISVGTIQTNLSGMINNVSGYFSTSLTNYYTKYQIDGLSGYINAASGYAETVYTKRTYTDSVSGYFNGAGTSLGKIMALQNSLSISTFINNM